VAQIADAIEAFSDRSPSEQTADLNAVGSLLVEMGAAFQNLVGLRSRLSAARVRGAIEKERGGP